MSQKNVLFRIAVEILIMFLAAWMGFHLAWAVWDIALFVFFIGIILRPISSRIPAGGALFFLALTPFFLIAEKKEMAEQLAIYAYYFLVMTVMMGVYEIKREEKKNAFGYLSKAEE